MLISNKPIKVAHLQKLANQPMVNGALGNDNNSFSESNKICSFDETRNVLIEKNQIKIRGAKNLFPLQFDIYLSYSEVQKNRKLIMFRSDFSKYKICSKFFTKTLYGNMFLVSVYIFKLVCHCESCR